MRKEIFSVLVITILLSSAITPLNILPDAEALKSQGVASGNYGSATRDKVCGDRLCSEIEKEEKESKSEKTSKGTNKDKEKKKKIPQEPQPQVGQVCTLEHMPVCGVDNKTYGNMCMLEVSGTELAYEGECKKTISSPISEEVLQYTKEPPIIDTQKGYFVTEIADGLYWLMDGTYQTMFMTTGQGVIAVDAPQSLGKKYLQAISDVTDEPVTHVIYSHPHTDHIGAAGMIFPEDATVIAQKQAAGHLVMKNDPNRPAPTISFDEQYTLKVGNQTLELYHIGNFHSKGDIIIYAPEQKIAMIVDFFHPEAAPFKNFGITQDMGVHLATHDVLLEMFDDDVLFVSGHESILGTKQHIQEYKQFTNDVLNNAYAAFGKVNFDEIVEKYGSNGSSYVVFNGYMDALSNSCVSDTVEQWSGKIDGLEVFLEDNCMTMVIYAMVD